MTRQQMAKEIKERTGLKLTNNQIYQILKAEEDVIFEVIASCDEFKYSWGKVRGIEKAPEKITGMFAEFDSVRAIGGWSNWKIGLPEIEWSKQALDYELHPPSVYFSLPANKYTTNARKFRQENKLPEIPEYQKLSEDKIKQMCKKADLIHKKPEEQLSKRKRLRKANLEKGKKEWMLIRRKYWIENDIQPMGMKHYTNDYIDGIEELEAQIHEADTIDWQLKHKFPYLEITEQYELVMNCIDIAKHRGEEDRHPELPKLKEQLENDMKELNIEIPEHTPRKFGGNKKLRKYKGQLMDANLFDEETGELLIHRSRPVYDYVPY